MPIKQKLVAWIADYPFASYMCGVCAITGLIGALYVALLMWFGVPSPVIVLLLLLLLLPFHDVAEIAVCKAIHIVESPHLLPEMDFSDGIPDGFKTLIVYASLIANKEAAAHTLECMERTHRANNDTNLPVAISTHFRDSTDGSVTEDEKELIDFVIDRIAALNKKYGRGRFFLFHRDREWNAVSQKWIGWERKRGGVEKLNRWLLGKLEGEGFRQYGPGKTFSTVAGDVASLGTIRNVILLDSDNVLPDGNALRLVRMAAHPDNHPCVDKSTNIVTRGYGVLQPFPVPTKESCTKSLYARLEGWHRRFGGAQHYLLQSLQDLLHESTFIGKGIYDVAVHERVLRDRFPENQLLSHDKVESGFLRAALVQDVVVLEEAADNFLAGVSQIERWLRGDKQVLAWALPRIPDSRGEMGRNPVSAFSRWNLIWYIKRQLGISALVIATVVGWFVPHIPSWVTSLILVGVVGFPYLVVPLRFQSPLSFLVGFARGVVSTIVYLSFYLHRALSILEASVRVTFRFPDRVSVTNAFQDIKKDGRFGSFERVIRTLKVIMTAIVRKPNIDWVTASEVRGKREIYSFTGICETMLPSIVVGVMLGLGCLVFSEGVAFTLSIVGLWLVAPFVVYFTSR